MKMKKEVLATGNPVLYCVDTNDDGDAAAESGTTPETSQPSTATGASGPPVQDTTKFDVVKATQYGALDRVKQLVDAGFDVNERDGENVTLLHWAAINNRKDIVTYFLKKGEKAYASER